MEHRFVVDAESAGTRLDKYLALTNTHLSRSSVQNHINRGMVTVNGQVITKKRHVLGTGDTIILTQLPEPDTVCHEDIRLDIRYQDEWLLIVNKPVGMVVHPAPGHHSGTLVNALLGTGVGLSETEAHRPGIVHRLDKDTSGLLLVAKTNQCQWRLSEMLKARQISRTYLALVHGIVSHDKGRIEGPIGRHPKNRTKMAIVENGKEAITHFNVLRRFQRHTLLAVKLETGRTHQIRVHFSRMGFPVVGDTTYGHSDPQLAGHLLHARTLEFQHPITSMPVSVTVGPPEEFRQRLRELFAYEHGGR
ncbi:MAG: RluA family pseudouridine synthase [Firmicutes bacterium]|nr:RluA family pseudouridine synthase [Bacillota bacterium]